jgi:hypothetical protein
MAFVLQSPALQQVTAQNPSQSFPLGVSDGSLLVCIFSWANTSGSVSGVSDSLGNPWVQIDFAQATLRTMYVFATQNATDGACTVTISTDASRTYTFGIFEIVGAAPNLDGTPVHTSGLDTNIPAGPLVTSIAGSIVFAAAKCGSISTIPSNPWTSKTNSNFGVSYQVTMAAGSFSTSWTSASSNYLTTMLAFQASPGPGPVLGPLPLISDLVSVGNLCNPIVLDNPFVGAGAYRTTWKTTQGTQPSVITNNPSDPSFNWTYLDNAVAQAAFYKKKASFHIAVQGFGQPNWVKANAQQYTPAGIAIWYDTYYQSALIAFIQAMGTRYGSNPTLFKVAWTICSTGGSWNVPHTAADITALTASPYNYTTAKLVTAQNTILSTTATAFPNCLIQLQVGTSGSLDVYPGGPIKRYNAATQISQYGYANITNFCMDRDGFDPFNPLPSQALVSQDQSSWYLLAQPTTGSTNTSGTTGSIPKGGTVVGQGNWQTVDTTGQYSPTSTNNYKANGGVPYVNPGPVISATLTLARSYFCAVYEMYEQDIIFSISNAEIFGAGSMLIPYKQLNLYGGPSGT